VSFLSQPISLIPIQPLRKIGDITVNVVINENTTDTLTVTKQPVQQGASITDHAYKEPTGFSTSIYFSSNLDKSLSQIYQQLLALQSSRVPFDIVTPKRIYNNMLMTTLSQTTDKNTENTLAISAAFQEIIIVSVSTTTVPRSRQKNPASTGATQPGGKKSALLSLTQGITGLFGGTQ
jgi:hypothetical protein